MSFEFFVGSRYLMAKQKQSFISLITFLSVAGITVGVMALIVVIAVMSGAEADFRSRILGVESHIVLMQTGTPFNNYRKIITDVENVSGVKNASPFIYTQIMLRSSSRVSGAVLRGIDPDAKGLEIKDINNIPLKQKLKKNNLKDSSFNLPEIILGKELASSLGVMVGDTVYIISPKGMISPIGHVPAMKRFKIVGIFQSGFYEYDSSLVYINLSDAQKIMRMGDSITGIGVRVDNIYDANKIADNIVSSLESRHEKRYFFARDWMEMNKNLFSALKLEKKAMFIILTLIVLVAAFNIASTLIMMVMEKTKDIAILKAMGATDKSIRKIFIFKGMIIGAAGTFFGMCSGFILCTLLKHYKFIELPGDVYYFTTLPVHLEFFDVFIIVSATLLICLLSSLYPASQAARLNPVEAIRYG